jgi:serine/threonine protein kinase
MNHPFKLAAKKDASPDLQNSANESVSGDSQENAPSSSAESAFHEEASSASKSTKKDRREKRSRQKRQRKAQHKAQRSQKYQFIHRLVGKLKQAESVLQTAKPPSAEAQQNPESDSSPNLALTHHGRETSPPMTFTYPPGSQPLPRYTIRRGIGVGGFGEVYFAVNDAGKEVAIKRIQRNLEIELRGASHCLNLKHPNLVSLYDICRDEDDQAWIVMEYVAGKNLRQILDLSPSGLTKDEVHHWINAIAAGVSHLHSAGLVHRDLKPANVFDDLGIVKVGDYGLSKFISASHRGGHTESVGTFHYMAPEIGRGQYGREIDIYALGIMLYELLTGRVPFDGESPHEIIVKHLTALPDLKAIQQPYRKVVAKCLEKDPTKRYQSVPEMMQALGLATSDAAVGVLPAQLVHDVAPPTAKPATAKPEQIESAILLDSGGRPASPGKSSPLRLEFAFGGSQRTWHSAEGPTRRVSSTKITRSMCSSKRWGAARSKIAVAVSGLGWISLTEAEPGIGNCCPCVTSVRSFGIDPLWYMSHQK